MACDRTALVLGATGGIGGEMARALRRRGWSVRALHRNPDAVDPSTRALGLDWHRGDAMRAEDIAAAAVGAAVIVHAVNPPGYRKWAELVLPMLDNTIAAARSCGARIVLPGTVYNYGADALPDVTEESPQNPTTAKGRIRADMEQRLQSATASGAKALIVRAGDYFGPHAANNWFSQALVKPGRPVTAITYPGKPGIGHQWAYLPDVAETMVQLLERAEALPDLACFHMQGHWDADGTQMIAAIRTALGRNDVKVSAMPWTLMRAASPFVPLFRELAEMRYLWEQPVRMRNERLLSVLGTEPHTPLARAVRDTLIGLGCLR